MRRLSKLHSGVPSFTQLRRVSEGDSKDDAIPVRGAQETVQDKQLGWHLKVQAAACSLFDTITAPERRFGKRSTSWRRGVLIFTYLAAIVFILNLATLIWAALNLDDAPYSTMSTNLTCDNAESQSWWFHLLINILSSVLLAGSSYCMQCLSAPTRDEIDKVHARNSFLDIGILSFRNVRSFSGKRAAMWALFALSSVPLHLLYNPVIQMTGAAQSYDAALVSEEFFKGAKWNSYDLSRRISANEHGSLEELIPRLQSLVSGDQAWNTTRWENITADTCVDHYSADPQMGLGTVLIMTDYSDHQNNSVFMFTQGESGDYILNWHARTEDQGHFVTGNGGFKAQILYCLGLHVPGRCSVQIHLWFLVVVVACNAVKLVCMLLTLWERREPLATLGDALESFLQKPCPASNGLCLLSEAEMKRLLKARKDGDLEGERPKRWQPERLRYYQAVKFHRWLVYTTLCAGIFMVAAYSYNEILVKYRGDHTSTSLSHIWKMWLGKLDINTSGGPIAIGPPVQTTIIRLDGSSAKLYVARTWLTILAANAPHTLVSIAYLLINSQLTAMVQLRDWSSLAARRQPLRVSSPAPGSSQISTYRLSLPYKYSLTLVASSTLLNWLLSQSLFFYRYKVFGDDGEEWDFGSPFARWAGGYDGTAGIGYSALGVVCTLAVGAVVFVGSFAVAAQSCEAGLPLGASNSLVISAACHPPKSDKDAGKKLVQWGVVRSDEGGVAHCSLTSNEVEMPVEGKFYL